MQFCLFKTICKFCGIKLLFKYFCKQCYGKIVNDLYCITRFWHKLCSIKAKNLFLLSCLSHKVALSFIKNRLLKILVRSCLSIEQTFKDELDNLSNYYDTGLYLNYPSLIKTWDHISFFDFHFSCYLSMIHLQFEGHVNFKNQKYMNNLICKGFGTENSKIDKHLFNFSNATLTKMECSVFAKGSEFCIPPD